MAWRRELQIKMNQNDNGCVVISVLKMAVFFFFFIIEEQSCTEKSILGVEYLNPIFHTFVNRSKVHYLSLSFNSSIICTFSSKNRCFLLLIFNIYYERTETLCMCSVFK
jgi:hypothetical protein